MTDVGPWAHLLDALDVEPLLLIGPGAIDEFATTTQRRHVPPGTLIPLAEGAAIADEKRRVLAIGGDEDLYGDGLGDLLHAARRNTPITCLVRDNGTGMTGATSRAEGPYPFQPLAAALAAGATYVAQTPIGDQISAVVRDASHHPGFALVNLIEHQPKKTRQLAGENNYDRQSLDEALRASAHPRGPLPIGVLYYNPDRSAFTTMVQPPAQRTDSDRWLRMLGDEVREGGDEPWA